MQRRSSGTVPAGRYAVDVVARESGVGKSELGCLERDPEVVGLVDMSCLTGDSQARDRNPGQ
jgi:hypothetical protein